MPGYPAQPHCQARQMTVVHGWNDDIVPVDNGMRSRPDNANGPPAVTCQTCNQVRRVRRFTRSWMMGVRISSMANPILPPGTTMVLRRDMKESLIMFSR